MKFDTIYVHAGLPKTGSTFLQNALERLEREGKLQHVGYPTLGQGEREFRDIGSGNGLQIALTLWLSNWKNGSQPQMETHVRDLLAAYQGPARNLLISSEQFFHATADGLNAMHALLRQHARSVKLLFVVRPLREWTYSIYMQLVKRHGQGQEFGQWLEENSSNVDSFKQLDRYEGEAIAIPYRDERLLELLLATVGEDPKLAAGIGEVLVNRSLSPSELEIIRMVNKHFGDDGLSAMISNEFLRVAPDAKSASFPPAAAAADARYVEATRERLAPFDSENMRLLKDLLFAESAGSSRAGAGDAAEQDAFPLLETALRCVRHRMDEHLRHAAAFKTLAHFAAKMERSSEFFDPIHYLILHPDLARTNTNPWLHYRDYGRKEGRHSALVRKA
jgi:hypothetical protein